MFAQVLRLNLRKLICITFKNDFSELNFYGFIIKMKERMFKEIEVYSRTLIIPLHSNIIFNLKKQDRLKYRS